MFKLLFDSPLFSKVGFWGTIVVISLYFALGGYPIIQNIYIIPFLGWGLYTAIEEAVEATTTKPSTLRLIISLFGIFGQIALLWVVLKEVATLIAAH